MQPGGSAGGVQFAGSAQLAGALPEGAVSNLRLTSNSISRLPPTMVDVALAADTETKSQV